MVASLLSAVCYHGFLSFHFLPVDIILTLSVMIVSKMAECSLPIKFSSHIAEGCLSPNRSPSRSPSPGSDSSPRLSRRGSLFRRSASPGTPGSRRGSTASTGYDQYQKSLLEVPVPTDYGDASSDDLSSEWDSDVPEIPKIQLPKVKNTLIFET